MLSRAGSPWYYTAPPDTLPSPDNDDAEGDVPIKRAYVRKKPWAADLRTNTETRSITWDDWHSGRRAWENARVRGTPLDAMVTVRPMDHASRTPEERWKWSQTFLRHLREHCRTNDNLPDLACIWSREARRDGTGEHMHLLVATGGRLDSLERYVKRKFPAPGEAQVDPRFQGWHYLDNGKVGDAASYVLKAASWSVREQYDKMPFRLSGPVFGPRCGWTLNLCPAPPRYRVPGPKRKKDRPSPERPLKQLAS